MSGPATTPAGARATDPGGPGVVVVNWTPAHAGLVEQLARTLAGDSIQRITCVGEGLALQTQTLPGAAIELVHVGTDRLGFDGLVRLFTDAVEIVEARAVIVLPRVDASEPDSLSRLTCAAIRRACGDRPGPNVLVEIEDPEAAFEFVGLGVATVFYSGHLRAALLGQACVDLGVFQFILGLLRRRQRIRTIEVPEALRSETFADAALALELDARGRPMTIIGITRPPSEGGGMLANPGPATPLRDVLGLVALVSGDAP